MQIVWSVLLYIGGRGKEAIFCKHVGNRPVSRQLGMRIGYVILSIAWQQQILSKNYLRICSCNCYIAQRREGTACEEVLIPSRQLFLSSLTWFQTWLFAFLRRGSFALFCALLRSCICTLLRSFATLPALICVFLRLTAFMGIPDLYVIGLLTSWVKFAKRNYLPWIYGDTGIVLISAMGVLAWISCSRGPKMSTDFFARTLWTPHNSRTSWGKTPGTSQWQSLFSLGFEGTELLRDAMNFRGNLEQTFRPPALRVEDACPSEGFRDLETQSLCAFLLTDLGLHTQEPSRIVSVSTLEMCWINYKTYQWLAQQCSRWVQCTKYGSASPFCWWPSWGDFVVHLRKIGSEKNT